MCSDQLWGKYGLQGESVTHARLADSPYNIFPLEEDWSFDLEVFGASLFHKHPETAC